MSTRHFLSVVLLAALVLNARASFYFTWNAPGAVNVGQNYTVGVQAYFTPSYSGDPYATLGLYRNGSQVGGGGTSAYGSATASNSFTDNSPQTVGYSADVYSYYGESDYSSHSVTVNGAPANKLGYNVRIEHQRDALNNSSALSSLYGNHYRYYKRN